MREYAMLCTGNAAAIRFPRMKACSIPLPAPLSFRESLGNRIRKAAGRLVRFAAGSFLNYSVVSAAAEQAAGQGKDFSGTAGAGRRPHAPSEAFSPVINLMLALDYEWSMYSRQEEVAGIFLERWPAVKAFLLQQSGENGKVSLHRLSCSLDSRLVELGCIHSLSDVLYEVDSCLRNTKHYRQMMDYCRDMLEIFAWEPDQESRWIGLIGDGMWAENPAEGEAYFREHLKTRNDTIMGYYSLNLLSDNRLEDALRLLEEYSGSRNDIIQERLMWIRKRLPKAADSALQAACCS